MIINTNKNMKYNIKNNYNKEFLNNIIYSIAILQGDSYGKGRNMRHNIH